MSYTQILVNSVVITIQLLKLLSLLPKHCVFQVKSLSEPFGICEEINPVPVSECQQTCKTEKVVERCGCHDVYMKPLEHGNGENTT